MRKRIIFRNVQKTIFFLKIRVFPRVSLLILCKNICTLLIVDTLKTLENADTRIEPVLEPDISRADAASIYTMYKNILYIVNYKLFKRKIYEKHYFNRKNHYFLVYVRTYRIYNIYNI